MHRNQSTETNKEEKLIYLVNSLQIIVSGCQGNAFLG